MTGVDFVFINIIHVYIANFLVCVILGGRPQDDKGGSVFFVLRT